MSSSSIRPACRAIPRSSTTRAKTADYEAVWEVATSITSEGWNAEFRIPFSQIRFTVTDGEQSVWGFQVRRDVRETGEWDLWNAAPRGTQGLVSRFGHLVFSDRLAPPRRIELMPFSLVRSEHHHEDGRSRGIDGGLDMRIGLGTSATLSATINPDFGQVELDPAVLNLSVFETFFPGKASVFSRRQPGVRPALTAGCRCFTRAASAERPDASSSATMKRSSAGPTRPRSSGPRRSRAKRTAGRTAGWPPGPPANMAASKRRPRIPTAHETTSRSRRLIEPATMFSMGRVQRDVLNGTSNVGAHRHGRRAREGSRRVHRRRRLQHPLGQQSLHLQRAVGGARTRRLTAQQRTDFGGADRSQLLRQTSRLRWSLRSLRQELPQHRSGISQRPREQELAVRRPAGEPAGSVEILAETSTWSSTPTSSGPTRG